MPPTNPTFFACHSAGTLIPWVRSADPAIAGEADVGPGRFDSLMPPAAPRLERLRRTPVYELRPMAPLLSFLIPGGNAHRPDQSARGNA